MTAVQARRVETAIKSLKGDRLRALVDAATDVAVQSEDRELHEMAKFALVVALDIRR